MTTRDLSGPVAAEPPTVGLPGELRPAQNEIPAPGGSPSLPSSGATTPGIALAAGHSPTAPTHPDGDPMGLSMLVSRMANDLFSAPPAAPATPPATTEGYTATPPSPQPPVASPPPGPALGPAPAPAPDLTPDRAREPDLAPGPAPALSPASPFDAPLNFGALFTAAHPSPLAPFANHQVPLLDPYPSVEPAATRDPAPHPAPLSPAYVTPTYDATPHLDLAPRGLEGAPLDPHALKREFPILRETVHGRPIVWLDNAATTQKPQAVIDRLTYFYEHENSNIHRAAHTLAGRATDAYESARESVRRFVNARSVRDIVFVRGATEGINLIAKSWGARHVGEGDEVVVSTLEHHANIVPWQQLCAEKGARLRVIPVDDRGAIKLDEYEKLLGPKTRLVAFTLVSNGIGTITPAKEMVEIAHRYGAKVLVDGAQAVSHMRVDVQDLDCDFFVFSGHKVFAPTGIGAVFGRSELLDAMPPWQGGGNMIQDVTFEKTTYQPAPARFEAGTGNIGDAVGLGAALDWLSRVGIERVEQYEHALFEYALHHLASVPGLTMIGSAPKRAGVLSFVLAGQKTESVGGMLDKKGIAVRSGHHCAQPTLRRFGVEASVRASLAPYNTFDDIDALVRALHEIQAGRPQAL